jgi:uncharacterized protein YjbI with pentapeptide repeats
MSNYAPNEDNLGSRIEQAINQDTNDFNQLIEILGFDPKTDFAEGNLSEFDLQNTSLTRGDFNHTRFDQANLLGADLSNANLKGANLSNTDLSNADLTGANIKGTNFIGANLENVIPATVEVYFQERELPKTLIADNELKSLVENFCSQERNTRQSTIANYKLLQAIQSLPQLKRSYQPEASFFSMDFEEILNETLLEVTERICGEFSADEIDYTRSLVKWIDYKLRLYYKPKDKLREASRHKTLSLDRYRDEGENSTFLDLLDNYEDGETLNTIDEMIKQAQQQRRHRLGKEVSQYLRDDPANRLKDCRSQKHPKCECHLLVNKRLLSDPPVSFQAIADELGIRFGTLTGHWAKKCKPLLAEIAQEFEKNLTEDID